MNWTDISINLPIEDLEQAEAVAQLVTGAGMYIEDYSDLTEEVPRIAHINLIDEALLARDRSRAVIHLYISPEDDAEKVMSFLGESLSNAGVRFILTWRPVKEEDWANNWKKYYHAHVLSPKLAICPSWENYEPTEGQKVLRLDPGMAFGTGTHETTRLCLQLLEESVKKGGSVLDIGTGSGILAIAARLLGSGETVGIDIDPLAVRTAGENALLNGVEDIRFLCGDLAEQVSGHFDIVCANIVADIIIRLAPQIPDLLKPDGIFIASGIISKRTPEVEAALLNAGFSSQKMLSENGWVAITFTRRG